MNSGRKSHYETLLKDIELAVREGRVPSVRPTLASLNAAQVPEEFRLAFAKLCRRVGLNDVGIRLLTPLKTQNNKEVAAEYAVLLQRAGVLDESLKMLKSIPRTEVPEADLYEAFCHFNRWEYQEALPLLRNYLSQNISPYDHLVGKVNLAAALTACDEFKEARELLAENIQQSRSEGNRRLEGNCYEILAQIQIIEKQFSEAKSSLEQAHLILGGENTVAELSVLKWTSVLNAYLENSTTGLLEFRKQALALKDWEALRHTDLHILNLDFSPELFHMHLFGSPWLGYREKAQRMLGRVIDVDAYLLGHPDARTLDVRTGQLDGKQVLAFGGSLHRTLEALLRDFYRPVSVGGLFGMLFPEEHYDIYSSPNRVHQLLFRLRKWCEEQNLPLEIQQEQDAYKLSTSPELALIVPYEKRTPDVNHQVLQNLKQAFPNETCFKLKQASESLGIAASQLRNVCNWAQEQGLMEKSGAGSSTLYYIPMAPVKKAA